MGNVLKARFIPTLQINGKWCMIISDYKFWMNNQVDLENWLYDNTEQGVGTQEGMTLNFATKEEMTWFLLRWDGR